MYSKKFEKAFAYVIENEGGFVFDKNDPGGETKFGITKRSYPSLNIKDLTLEDAKKIKALDHHLFYFSVLSKNNFTTKAAKSPSL